MWVKVGLGKSLCLCQVQPRLVPWGAKLCKPCHSGFLHRWWFLPGPNASQEIGLPSTGPVLGRVEPSVLVQYWSSTGPILAQYWPRTGARARARTRACARANPMGKVRALNTGPVLAQYWPNTGQGRALSTGPVLAQYWPSTGPVLAQYWPNTCPVLGRVEPSVLAQYWANTGQHTLAQAAAPQ